MRYDILINGGGELILVAEQDEVIGIRSREDKIVPCQLPYLPRSRFRLGADADGKQRIDTESLLHPFLQCGAQSGKLLRQRIGQPGV